MSKTAVKTKNIGASSATVTAARYTAWVRRVRQTEVEARRVVLKRYHLLLDGKRRGIHKGGPYRDFYECIMREFGISAAVWNGLQQTVARFGEDTIESLGYEACVTMLRLPAKSTAEQAALREIASVTQKYGGRAPSSEAVGRIVTKYVGPLKPVDAMPTIVERLRAELRQTKEKLREARGEVRALKAELRKRGKAKK